MMAGYIKLHRGRLWEHEAFQREPFTEREAFLWIIENVAYKNHSRNIRGKVVEVPRGKMIASLRFLCDAWRWKSTKRVSGFLSRMVANSMLEMETEKSSGWTQITLCNYDKFQGEGNSRETTKETAGKQTRRRDNNSLPTEGAQQAAPQSASPKVDPLKVMFDSGRALLAEAGVSKANAGKLLGKWRKALGTEGVIVALGKCQKEGAIDPVSFIEGIIRHKAKLDPANAPVRSGGIRIRDLTNTPKPKGATHENRLGNPDGGVDHAAESFGREPQGDMPGMQPAPEEEEGYVPFGDDPIGRGGAGVLSSLRMEVC